MLRFLVKWIALCLWDWLFLVNWITLCLLLKLLPRKLEPWFVLWIVFLLRLLCIFINLPYDHSWNTFVLPGLVVMLVVMLSCLVLLFSYLKLLDKLQKWICRFVGPSLAVSLKPLVHSRNKASLNLSIGITLVHIHWKRLN